MRQYRYTGRFREARRIPEVPGAPRDPFERYRVRRPLPVDQRLTLDQAMDLAAKLHRDKGT